MKIILTKKEEEILSIFWQQGPIFVKDMQALYSEPIPHINTLSTIVRLLENKGFVAHESFGKAFRYFALVSEEEYRKKTLKELIRKYFDNSFIGVVSSFVQDEDISVDELKELVNLCEEGLM